MHTRVCNVCGERRALVNFWTEVTCKYCWQKAGKKIYAYDQRDTSQYRNNKERKREHHKRNELLRDAFKTKKAP